MESNDIRTILAEIAETALLTANPLPWWNNWIQIMLEKWKGQNLKSLESSSFWRLI